MVGLYAINISEIIDLKEVSEFTSIISCERKFKVDKFIFIHDKIQSILAEALLRYILHIRCNIKQSEIVFKYNTYGKPYLSEIKNVHFNLSHSGEWVVCGICDNPIGIDIEKINERDSTSLWSCLSSEEYRYILGQPKENQKDSFYKIWTLKESYIKYMGIGLSISIGSFSCRIGKKDITIIVDNNLEDKICLKAEKLYKDYYVSVCVNDSYQNMIGNIEIIKLGEMKKWLNM